MTRIAVVGLKADMFWQSMGRMLQTDDHTEVLHLASLAELTTRADAGSVDVAILPWSRANDGYPWLDRLGKPNCRATIGLDSSSNEAVLWTRDVDQELLRRLSELFGKGLSLSAQVLVLDSPSSVQTMDSESLDRPRALLTWAELLVRARLAEFTQDVAESLAIPGWTAGLGQIRALMGASPIEDRAALREAILEIERQFGPDDLVGSRGTIPLGPLERRILVLTLAPELDGRFHFAYGYLHNDLTRTYATEGLLAHLLAEYDADSIHVRDAVRDGVIAQFGLLEFDVGEYADRSGPECPLRVPADLVEIVVRGGPEKSPASPALRVEQIPAAPVPNSVAATEFRQALTRTLDRQMVQLVGPRPAGDWASAILSTLGHHALRIDCSRLQQDIREHTLQLSCRIARLGRLSAAVPILEGAREGDQQARDLSEDLAGRLGTVIVDLETPWTPGLSVSTRIIEPFADAQPLSAADWQEAAHINGIEIAYADAAEMAATRRGDPALAAAVCRHLAASLGAGAVASLEQLRRTAKALSAPSDGALVQRIEPVFGWDDIVLAEDRLQSLKQIPQQVRHAARVMQDWGYAARMPLGQGVAALFAGPSGTGKTMASQIIAADLGVEVFHVDLAKTVSKYIGDTEKHLDTAFALADRASAVLVFDEADALFGKRTEVKDAHDRHANVEVAYLLQRLEEYRGVAVLTTNFKQNMDTAFLRRLRFVVDFPSPDTEQRLAIWKRAAPREAPGWSDLDFRFLAERFQLTGGHIQQISVAAAFLAAAEHAAAGQEDRYSALKHEGAPRIEMTHVLRATRQQLMKLGMVSAGKTLHEESGRAGVRSA